MLADRGLPTGSLDRRAAEPKLELESHRRHPSRPRHRADPPRPRHHRLHSGHPGLPSAGGSCFSTGSSSPGPGGPATSTPWPAARGPSPPTGSLAVVLGLRPALARRIPPHRLALRRAESGPGGASRRRALRHRPPLLGPRRPRPPRSAPTTTSRASCSSGSRPVTPAACGHGTGALCAAGPRLAPAVPSAPDPHKSSTGGWQRGGSSPSASTSRT